MDAIQPLYPSSLDDPEPVHDELVDHWKAIEQARACPCWKCPKRPTCRDNCDRYKRYVISGRQ